VKHHVFTKLRDVVKYVAESKMILKKLHDAEMILKTKKTKTVKKRGCSCSTE
jgi:hypothetical protein